MSPSPPPITPEQLQALPPNIQARISSGWSVAVYYWSEPRDRARFFRRSDEPHDASKEAARVARQPRVMSGNSQTPRV